MGNHSVAWTSWILSGSEQCFYIWLDEYYIAIAYFVSQIVAPISRLAVHPC